MLLKNGQEVYVRGQTEAVTIMGVFYRVKLSSGKFSYATFNHTLGLGKYDFLIKLKIGESTTIPACKSTTIWNAVKRIKEKIGRTYKTKTTNKGIKVTRVS